MNAADWDLTDDQRDVRDAARALAASFGDTYWSEHDEAGEFPTAFYDAFAAQGWLGIMIPERYGGSGLGVGEAAILLEEIAGSGAGMNGCSALHLTIFALNVVALHGSEKLRAEVLPAAASGALQICFAVTEREAGSDTARIATHAHRDGDGYVISGHKVWITKAAQSQKMLLVARTSSREAAHPTRGLSLFLIDVDDPAVELRPIAKMGRNAVTSYEVFIGELRAPAEALVGEEGNGFRHLLDGLNPERILLAHEALGLGRAALERAVRYARERVVFDRPIGRNQGIAFPLAEALARLDAARLMARRAARLYDQGLPCAREANMAKYLCADAGFQAADRAVQTHGGMGYAREYHVERYFREARLLRLAPVSQEMVLNYIAEHVMGLDRSY
ncbi:MAG TPA: acyl-CoA dehydrogenase family protein [Solirubrobacteraceae bacterium]|nr:acyl-CoA dehydrogenase family protein [Solirubrobacteraceae bacterium]